MQRSKLSETDLFKKKEKPAKQSEHITKSFRLTRASRKTKGIYGVNSPKALTNHRSRCYPVHDRKL